MICVNGSFPKYSANTLKKSVSENPSVCPGWVNKLATYIFLAFDFKNAFFISATKKTGRMLENKFPGPTIITSAALMASIALGLAAIDAGRKLSFFNSPLICLEEVIFFSPINFLPFFKLAIKVAGFSVIGSKDP